MRTLALLMLLAACDQGAKAAPPPPPMAAPAKTAPVYKPYMVTSDADFVEKATTLVNQLFAVLSQGGRDCKLVARDLRAVNEQNRTKIEVLTRYGEQHKQAQDALQRAIQEPMRRFLPELTATMQACANDKDLAAALAEMSQAQNLQRPR